ncbi:MAG: S41 family peptidase [Planctomycetota bacterium]
MTWLPPLLVAVLWVAGIRGEEAAPQKGAIDAWIRELSDEQPDVRERAAAALVRCGRPALGPVRELLRQGGTIELVLLARRVHGGILGLSVDVAEALEEQVRRVAAGPADPMGEALDILQRGEEATCYALSLCRQEKGSQRVQELHWLLGTLAAVRDLAAGNNAADRANEALQELGAEALQALPRIASNETISPIWRAVATERLVHLGGTHVLEPLVELSGGGDAQVRELALRFVAHAAPPAWFAPLVSRVSSHLEQEPAVRQLVERFADRLTTETLRGFLELGGGVARADASAGALAVQAVAAAALGRRRDTESRPRLVALVQSASPAVTVAALGALAKVGGADEVEPIAKALTSPVTAVRRAALRALGELRQPHSLGWMATGLSDADPSVRVAAAESLELAGSREAVASLVAALDDADPVVLRALSAGLEALAGERLGTLQAFSDENDRRNVCAKWRQWWRGEVERPSTDEKTRSADSGGESASSVEESVLRHVEDGARILERLQDILTRTFRPYARLKEEQTNAPDRLKKAAAQGILELLALAADDEDERLRLTLDDRGQRVLTHLLQHGEFGSAADLGRAVGSLPIALAVRDYILLIEEAARAMVRQVGDRFTRLQLLSDAEGKVRPDALPSLFGTQELNGLILQKTESGAEVDFVYAMTPAHRAGLRRGDRVLSLNGDLTAGLPERVITRRLGKPVDLLVMRDGWSRPVPFKLVPERLREEDLVRTAMLPGKIGYLRLREFDLGCAQKVEWALRRIESDGMKALIFDVRGNPGGTVLDAIALVDKFVPEGEIITTTWVNSPESDKEHEEEVRRSTASENDRGYPLAVLVDSCSASASEMFSGALQDLKRAVIVGRTSFGKGIGQSGEVIPGFARPSILGEMRSSFAMGVTVLEYFLPTGRSIHGKGVEPDEVVGLPKLVGERFETLRRVIESGATREFATRLVAEAPERALELARYDGFDPGAYQGLEELRESLHLEASREIVRQAVRYLLRETLAAGHDELRTVDNQEDDDVRAAVAKLAEKLGLDLTEIPVFADLAP